MTINSSVHCSETTSLLRTPPEQLPSFVGDTSPDASQNDKGNKLFTYACLLGSAVAAVLFIWVNSHVYTDLQTQTSPFASGYGGMRVHLEGVTEGVYLRVDSTEEGQGAVVATESIPWAAGSSLTVALGAQDCWCLQATWSGKWLTAVAGGAVVAHSEDGRDATCFEATTMSDRDSSSSRVGTHADDTLLSFRVSDTDTETGGWLTLVPDAAGSNETSSSQLTYYLTTTSTKEDTSVFRVHVVDLLKGVNLGRCPLYAVSTVAVKYLGVCSYN